ncbi:hypothetical protein DITRI_Ditri02bG0084100 [Diplodiscus trichospermus]
MAGYFFAWNAGCFLSWKDFMKNFQFKSMRQSIAKISEDSALVRCCICISFIIGCSVFFWQARVPLLEENHDVQFLELLDNLHSVSMHQFMLQS